MSSKPFCHTIYYENRQTSETYISKTYNRNDIKFGRVVKNAIVYHISKVFAFDDII